MTPTPRKTSRLARGLLRLGAGLFLLLGLIGAVLPIMPTTIFLLLSVWCLVRLGDRRAAILLNHPRLGRPLRLFIEQGAIARRGKVAAVTGLSLGGLMLLPLATAQPWLVAGCATGLALIALYLVTRPAPTGPVPRRDIRSGLSGPASFAAAFPPAPSTASRAGAGGWPPA